MPIPPDLAGRPGAGTGRPAATRALVERPRPLARAADSRDSRSATAGPSAADHQRPALRRAPWPSPRRRARKPEAGGQPVRRAGHHPPLGESPCGRPAACARRRRPRGRRCPARPRAGGRASSSRRVRADSCRRTVSRAGAGRPGRPRRRSQHDRGVGAAQPHRVDQHVPVLVRAGLRLGRTRRNGLSASSPSSRGRSKSGCGGSPAGADDVHRLDQSGDPGGRLRMPDVDLHRAEPAEAGPGGGRPQSVGQAGQLDLVAEWGAGAVRLDVAHRVAGHLRDAQRGRHHRGDPGRARRGEAGPVRPVVAGRAATDHREHRVAVGQRVGQPAQRHCAYSGTAGRPGRAAVEGAAVAVLGQQPARLVAVAGVERLQSGAAGERDVALAGEQAERRVVHGRQRRRAGRLHGHGRAVQAEPVGDPGREEVGDAAEVEVHVVERRGAGGPRPGQVEQGRVRAEAGAGEDRDLPVAVPGRVAGGLQCLPAGLQEDPLLRVDQLGLAGRVAEELAGELVHGRQGGRDGDVVVRVEQLVRHAGGPQPVLRQRAAGDHAVVEVAPEVRRRPGVREPAADAHDGDGAVRVHSGPGAPAPAAGRPPPRARRPRSSSWPRPPPVPGRTPSGGSPSSRA